MWFTASLLFNAECKAAREKSLWEEEIVLFEAEDELAAASKAAAHGRSHEHEYTNDKGELVRWVFKHVERICPVESTALVDGTELFSRFLKDSEVQSLLTGFEDRTE